MGKSEWVSRTVALSPSRSGLFRNLPESLDRTYSLDSLLQEYSGVGNCDYRTPALDLQNADGSFAARLVYQGYEITEGKPKLEGLPAAYANADEAQTLALFLKDASVVLK